MTADLFDPPELRLADDVLDRRRAHLLAELAPAPTPWRWRLLAPVAAVAVVVAAALLVVRPAPTRLTLVDQALAAIGSGPTVHVVLEVPNAAQLLDVKTGRARSLSAREEFWADPKLGAVYVQTLGGRVTQRFAAPRRSWNDAVAAWRPFVTGYQKQLKQGTFHVISGGRVDGRAVEWIGDGKGEQIAISKTTYRPLAVRYLKNGRVVPALAARVVLAETLARKPSLFAKATPQGLGGQTSFPGASTGIRTSIAAARAAMSPGPLIPKATIGTLHRTWIGLPDYLRPPASSYKDEVNGLTLYYGPLDAYGDPRWLGRYVAINELPSRHDADVIWGEAFFRTGVALLMTPGSTRETTATIELKGLYVAIQASDRGAAVAAVRALAEGR